MTDSEKEFENLVRDIRFDDTPDSNHREKLEQNLLSALNRQSRHKSQALKIWRIIMKSRRRKLVTAAVILIAVALSVTILDRLTTPAWAIEQTFKALKQVNSLVISGTTDWDSTSIPFKFWIRPSKENAELFDMRFECEESIFVVRGKRAWVYWPDKNIVTIYQDVTESDGMMRDLQFWYDMAQLNPWISGKVLSSIKWIVDDWQEAYDLNERTGRDCVFVTCSYEPESRFWLVCDLETKLIVEAKYWNWSSEDHEGRPACHATSFAYNEDISDEVFEFQIPEGAEVIHKAKVTQEQKQAQALSERAENLFFNDKNYTESLELYQQIYEKFPDLNNGVDASNALMMIGSCYEHLGKNEKAIESFRKKLEEFKHLEGLESTYFYLGCVYTDQGEKEKAIEAYKNCLKMGEGFRDPDKFPLRHARENIEELQSRK
jgi:outer membrane lipoprotein-sorting protein